MHKLQPGLGRFAGLVDLVWSNHTVVQQAIAQQPKLWHRKAMPVGQRDHIVGVIDNRKLTQSPKINNAYINDDSDRRCRISKAWATLPSDQSRGRSASGGTTAGVAVGTGATLEAGGWGDGAAFPEGIRPG